MLTILLANVKGGCGKTTLATNLAAAFAGGGFVTALADRDRQKSSLDWAKRRPSEAAPIKALDWTRGRKAPPVGTQRLIIDAPAAMRIKDAEELIAEADIILLPVLPSAFDERATGRFLKRIEEIKAVRKRKTLVGIIGNRVRERTRAAQRLDEWLEGLGHKTVTRLRDSALYTDVALDGLGLFDLPGRRAAEVREDWRPLVRFIEDRI